MKILEFLSFLMIPIMILGILCYGLAKKQKVYELFIKGVLEGLKTMLHIFPSILSIMIAIHVFKFSGGMQIITWLLTPLSTLFHIPAEIVPLGIMRSVSGGASMGLLIDVLKGNGPDSMIGKIASTIMGSSETTLYVMAVYLSATHVKKTRNILLLCLFCDFVAIVSAVYLCKLI